MSEYTPRIGDVVKASTRKDAVLYTVTWTPESVGMAPELADPEIQSHNTGKLSCKAASALILVESHPEIADVVVLDKTAEAEAGRAFWGIAEEGIDFVSSDDEDEPLKGTVVSLVPERSSYSKAILNGLQAKAGHVFEGVSLSSKARARRKAARRAAKISRKANR